MKAPHAIAPQAHTPRLRSGTAARLSGLPVTTLRVWERRYGVIAAPKTSNGQRLYSELDVQRLSAMRQLTGRGHAIGTIANLDLAALQALLAGLPSPEPAATSMRQQRVVVVGRSAVQRLKSTGVGTPLSAYDDLEEAEAGTPDTPAAPIDLLLVHLASLQPALAEHVLALASRLRARAVTVLYAFGADATAERLRAQGATVRRDPLSGRELARLVAAAPHAPPPAAARWQASPRRYSDAALIDLAELPSPISCECLRHVAEIVTQLASFERYSADCLSRSPADAALHRRLSDTAGAARTMFEQALDAMLESEDRSTEAANAIAP